MNRYLFEYRHDHSTWGIEIIAKSPQDARERISALNWAVYKGEVVARIPVPCGGLIASLIGVFRR